MAARRQGKLSVSDMERMCKAAQMKPAKRDRYQGYDIYVSDGFSEKPWIHYQKFLMEEDGFPNGCYCTIWFATERGSDRIENLGQPLLFDAYHDLELGELRRHWGRVNKALGEARAMIDQKRKVRLDA